ncbi:ice-binding family protein [Nonomuraea sp. NPDC000554]|uniref:ice-binding family protein n=1 Tax=Nonomuraea sp. NPDC000554 TaxID=3154259 RepID=UPI0033214A35
MIKLAPRPWMPALVTAVLAVGALSAAAPGVSTLTAAPGVQTLSAVPGASTVSAVPAMQTLSVAPSRRRQPPRPVNLGSSAPCAVLADSAVYNTDLTTITGNLGISPGDVITGFPPGQVRGEIHIRDPRARAARDDAVVAYNDAAGRVSNSSIAPELGGKTLTPGVYDTPGGAFQITGTLTLDAAGDQDAAFIFQADTALTTARVSNINLINGAQADNVVWQVGDSASLGTLSTFRGTVLAWNSVTVAEGTAVDGRVMALNRTVTLAGRTALPATRVTIPGNPPTSTTLTSSPNPSRREEPVTFTATVTGNFQGFAPTNEVLFRDGDTVIGSAMLDVSGKATFTTSSLTRGVHPITAVYVDGGTAVNEAWVNFAPSTSPVVQQQVLNRREG